MVYQRLPIVATVHEDAGKIASKEPIEQEQETQHDQGPAADASACLKYKDDQKRSHDDIHRVGRAHAVDEVDVVDPDIDSHSH